VPSMMPVFPRLTHSTVMVERSTPNQQASTSCVTPVAKVHEGGQEPVDEAQPVLRAGTDHPLPEPGDKPGLVSVRATKDPVQPRVQR
jgi:hypothetical protein